MALSLATGADLVGNATFQQRVAMGFYFVARQVLSENPTTEGHEDRVVFARSIITQGYNQFLQYAAVVATDSAIVAGGPYSNPVSQPGDQAILDAITSVWTRLASVRML